MSAWINKLEKYDRTGAIAGGMFFWLPSLSVLVAHEWLPGKIVLFLVLVCVLSLAGIALYLFVEGKLTPAKRLLFGSLGWALSLALVFVYVYSYYQ